MSKNEKTGKKTLDGVLAMQLSAEAGENAFNLVGVILDTVGAASGHRAAKKIR